MSAIHFKRRSRKDAVEKCTFNCHQSINESITAYSNVFKHSIVSEWRMLSRNRQIKKIEYLCKQADAKTEERRQRSSLASEQKRPAKRIRPSIQLESDRDLSDVEGNDGAWEKLMVTQKNETTEEKGGERGSPPRRWCERVRTRFPPRGGPTRQARNSRGENHGFAPARKTPREPQNDFPSRGDFDFESRTLHASAAGLVVARSG